MPRDLMLFNGSIRTMDPVTPHVEAILIRQGRIWARGDTQALLPLASDAHTIDLGGRTAVPGLEDAHLHLCAHGLSLGRLRLEYAQSLEQAITVVQTAALHDAGSGWLRGAGWDHNLWPNPVKPTRIDLDRVCPHRPVVLESKDLHSLWMNSIALEQAGIDANTPDVPGGEIARDEAGRPTGILSENARTLLDRAIPAPTSQEWRRAAKEALADAARLGLTAVHSCEGPEAFGALAELECAGELPLRVWHMIPFRYLPEALALHLRSGLGSERLRIGHVKMFADGALGSGTAEMLMPYADSDTQGVAATSTEAFHEAVLAAARGGLASAIHAIGDAANRRVIDVFERVAGLLPGHGLRQRIEHVQLITPEDQARLSGLGIVASMQPIHATQDRLMAERRWGSRCRYAYPWRSLASSGARLAFGTDCPVEGLNPLANLYAAITRRPAGNTSISAWYPKQAVSLHQALLAYTWGSAYAAYAERERGSLTVGKCGDVTVFSQPLLDDTPETLLQARVDYTIVDGRIVFAR